jgi:hypothetical protein
MATDLFRGLIGMGQIKAEFLSDFSNADPDLLIISYAPTGGGGGVVDRASANPGGQATVRVAAAAQGVLEVSVITGVESDSGRLRVLRDGAVVHDTPAVMGATRWVYSVQ